MVYLSIVKTALYDAYTILLADGELRLVSVFVATLLGKLVVSLSFLVDLLDRCRVAYAHSRRYIPVEFWPRENWTYLAMKNYVAWNKVMSMLFCSPLFLAFHTGFPCGPVLVDLHRFSDSARQITLSRHPLLMPA